MQQIPQAVREYLSTNDALLRAQLFHTYPQLRQTLDSPETRKTILTWLTSDEAWEPATSAFTAQSLEFLRSRAVPSEDQIIRSFLLHPDAFVRLRAYEFLLSLYFPDKNREAMFLLLHGMLADGDDIVRTLGARYIERANAVGELKDFLERWLKAVPARGWADTESFELVDRLLKQ